MDDIFIRYIKLPYKTHGLTSVDENGDYNIYINSEICAVKQHVALQHELNHISHNHFYDEKPLDEDEQEADADSTVDKSVMSFLNWEGIV